MPLIPPRTGALFGLSFRLPGQWPIWLLSALVLGAVWLLTFERIDDDRAKALAGAESDLVNLGRLSQEHAERTLYSVDQTLRMLRGQHREHQGKPDLKGMREQGLIDSRILVGVGVIDEQGILVQSSLALHGRVDLSDRDYFQFHTSSDRDLLFISRPVVERTSGKWGIQLSRRITRDDGAFGGVVVASVDPAYFTHFYTELKLGEQGLAALVGLDGAVLARRNGAQQDFSGDFSASPVFARMAHGEVASTISYASITDGIERTHHFRKLPSYPLLVSIGMSTRDILAEPVQTRLRRLRQAGIFSLLVLVLVAVATWHGAVRRRERAAQALVLSRLQDLIRHAPGVVYQYLLRQDGSSCFPFASGGLRELCQLSAEEVALDAVPFFSMIHAYDAPGVEASIEDSARGLTPWVHEFRICLEDGTVRWLAGNAAPRRQADGTLLWNGFLSDVTERKEREESLITLSVAVDQSPVSIVIVDLDASIQYVNRKFEQITGYTAAEVIGQNPRIMSSGNKSAAEYREMWDTLLAGKTWDGEFHNRRKDGTLFWEHATISPVLDEHGVQIHYLAIKEDITERKQADAQLRIAAIAFESQEGMFVSDAAGVMLRVNQAFTDITGYTAEEAVGQTPRLLSSGRHDPAFYAAMRAAVDSSGSWQGEIWNRRKNGEIFPEWLTITAVKDAQQVVTHYVSTLTDITRRKAAEDQIQHLAFYDPLTGLPNRRLLIDRLHQAMAAGTRSGCEGALLFIDLDNFKALNDAHGHGRGDLLLQQVGQRLAACVREGDTVARLGGDEYVVMLEDLSKRSHEAASQAEALGGKILYSLNLPFDLVGNEYHITPSIGVTLFAGHQHNAEELMKRADLAMYQAKAAGRNTLRFFDPEMQAAVTARVAMEQDLRCGLQENQFLLEYQPQVDEHGRLTGVEALVRWQHPLLGRVSPADFVPLAEDAGLILPLGHWVLLTACHQLKAWADQAHTAHLTLSVNVSALQFHLDNFVSEVLAVLRLTGAPPSRLKLELTESLLVKDVDAIIAKMLELKAFGVGFSLDDFGTGYSSLSYLKRLPLDQLKIDQSFLHEALTNPNDAAIVRAIVTLGQSLGMMVIAEGVETLAQRDFLVTQGCYSFQGYYFGRPAPVQALEKFFRVE
jgi:diguanylate cyclase (GGDEF)-like protein/PAS domain S-box-containing protein